MNKNDELTIPDIKFEKSKISINCITACTGGDSCCTTTNKCGEDEGDCDKDSDCKEGLTCGNDNCIKNSGIQWDATDDCCYRPGSNVFFCRMLSCTEFLLI